MSFYCKVLPGVGTGFRIPQTALQAVHSIQNHEIAASQRQECVNPEGCELRNLRI